MVNFGQKQGLSQASVTVITQDQQGFIWLGTQAGLNRFDGYEFKQFFATPQTQNALAGNFINDFCLVEGLGLWIGTSTGLSFYDFKRGGFRSYLQQFYPTIPSDQVTSLACDAQQVLVGTQSDGVYRFQPHSDQITIISLANKGKVNGLAFDDDVLYVANFDGVQIIDLVKKTATQLSSSATTSLLLAGDKIVQGRHDGVITMYNKSAPYERTWHKDHTERESNVIHSLILHQDLIWVGSNEGVLAIDTEGERKQQYQHNAAMIDSLADNMVLSLAFDDRDNLWIGSESGGLNFLTSRANKLGYISQFQYASAPLDNPDVRGFSSDPLGRLWVATTRGMYIFDGNKFLKAEKLYPQLAPFSHSFVSSLYLEQQTMWLTTRGDGVVSVNLNSGELQLFSSRLGNAPSLDFNRVTQFNEQILLSSRSHSVLVYDTDKKMLLPFFSDQLAAPDQVTDMLVKNGVLWLGTLGEGIYRFEEQQLSRLTSEDGLVSNLIFMLAMDDQQRIWASSEVGVNLINSDFTLNRVFSRQDGLKNDAIWSLVYDKNKSIWLGTSGGLIRINTTNFSYENYVPSDGAQGLEYNFGAAWLADDGLVFIGGSQGFNQFYPNEITPDLSPANLVLTDISILGKNVSPSDDDALISQPADQVKSIKLDYYQDIMSFKYASLTFSATEQLSYFYRVLGLSDTWLPMEQGSRQVNLLKLPAGNYQVETYAIDQFGNQSDIHTLSIHLLAPWWWNNISKLFYLVSLLMVVSLFVVSRQKAYRKVVADNRAMAELKQRLELSLWASGDELWDWDVTTNQIHRYCVASRIDYGEQTDSFEIKTFSDFVHPKDRAKLREDVQRCIENQSDHYEVAVRVKDFFGNWVWVMDKGQVIERDENHKPLRVVGALKDINQLKIHEKNLQDLNDKLEAKVAARTEEISSKNLKLEQAMLQLKDTQEELIQSEKMASLGGLVAGVAHEINTPLGIAITAISYNQDCLASLKVKLDTKALKQSDLEQSIEMQGNGYELIMKNLERANQLISSFKQVAVDQSSESLREINLTEYLHDVVYSLKPLWNKKDIHIQINGPDHLLFTTYPGALHQICTNLINNSIIHGFEGLEQGSIRLEVSLLDSVICFDYFDNGHGMSASMVDQVFAPFVTSKRSQGGSGLGMHIVFNLITQLFKGDIRCYSSQGHGIELKMRLPLHLPENKVESHS